MRAIHHRPYRHRATAWDEAKRLRWWITAALTVIAASTAQFMQW